MSADTTTIIAIVRAGLLVLALSCSIAFVALTVYPRSATPITCRTPDAIPVLAAVVIAASVLTIVLGEILTSGSL